MHSVSDSQVLLYPGKHKTQNVYCRQGELRRFDKAERFKS